MDPRFIALCTCFGLALTAAGAGIAAEAVFRPPDDTKPTIGWAGANKHLRKIFSDQGAAAKTGLRMIVAGTIIQILTTAAPQLFG